MPVNRQPGLKFASTHPRLANVMLVIVSLVIAVPVIDLVADKDGTRTHVSINAFGFPDDERAVAKDRPRIALVGDSTAEFWEVQQDERAPRVIERMLDGRVEVLNFGLRGAGTDQELIRYQQQVVPFSPNIVVLFFCVNDLGNNVTKESKPWFALDPEAPGGVRLEGMPIRVERGLDVRQLMHREDTMHLNAEGVRLFSTAVIERIRALGWLAEQPATLGHLSRRRNSSACAPAGSCLDPLY